MLTEPWTKLEGGVIRTSLIVNEEPDTKRQSWIHALTQATQHAGRIISNDLKQGK
jgi:hypothetical protein